MARRNPLARITDAAQDAATVPLKVTEKVADRAVGVLASGVRMAASLIYSTAGRARSMVGIEDEQGAPAPTEAPFDAKAKSPDSSRTSTPGPVTAPPAEPLGSVEELAEAAVAREMAEEPLTTPTSSKAARARKPAPASASGDQADDEPLIDKATAKAVQSETEILRAAADVDKDL